jgi:hypothetical protein
MERRLPGESASDTPASSRRRRGEAGAWVARLEAPAVSLRATVLEGSDDRTLRRADAPKRFIIRGELVSKRARP